MIFIEKFSQEHLLNWVLENRPELVIQVADEFFMTASDYKVVKTEYFLAED